VERYGYVKTSAPREPYFGIEGYSSDGAKRRIRDLFTAEVLLPPSGATHVGFKEIRWDYPDLPDFLEWIVSCFGEVRFTVNLRNLDAVSASMWWAADPDAKSKLKALEKLLLLSVESVAPDSHYIISYDQYTNDIGALRGLFDWLGAPFDARAVANSLAIRHSY
jgi:hypothetical protein